MDIGNDLFIKVVRFFTDYLDIELRDHIVIGNCGYTSIRELHPEIFLKGRLI